MKDISEKISYLQGLSEGLNVNEGTPQGKIINGILGVLDELADIVTVTRIDFERLKDYVESIDDDLFEMEEHLHHHCEDDLIELDCPHCGEELYFEADLLDDDDIIEITCPNCDEVVFVNDGSFDYRPSLIDDDEEEEEPFVTNPSPS